MTDKVGPKGQVVIAKDLRDEFGIEPDDEVTFWRADHVAVQPMRSTQPLKARFAGSALVDELDHEHAADRARGPPVTVVLDSWAVLRLLEGTEPAASRVQVELDGDVRPVMSWINVGEVTYRQSSTEESDRKVIGLVRETGEINARMVRLLLDLVTPATSRLLADLVERGLLAKTFCRPRGPSVTYGPGTRFPSQRGKRTRIRRQPPEQQRPPEDDTAHEG